MTAETIGLPLIYINKNDSETQVDNKTLELIKQLQQLIELNELPISLLPNAVFSKLTQKRRQQLSEEFSQPILVIDDKNILHLLVNGVSVSPDWKSLQRRIVTAGRKSELVLQACKLTDKSKVLDATAGFGHDSLILASSGADVTLLERNPLMVLMLLIERQRMMPQVNWQKLMSRLTIKFNDLMRYMTFLFNQVDADASDVNFDVVYLDPMFPDNSYENSQTGKGAKVGKHMQALHCLAEPPTTEEEEKLLQMSLNIVKQGGRVVVKRPVSAPPLANHTADESWQNNVVRFDGYFK